MERMTVGAIALWVAAVAVAVAASTAAVTLATNSVNQPPPVGLPSPRVDPSPDAGTTDARTPAPPASPTDDTVASPTRGDDGGDGTDGPSPAANLPSGDAGDAGDDGPDGDPGPAPAQEQTATSVGGTARFRFEDGDVTVVFATPAQGFTVEVDDEGREVRVTFTSADHESRIDADHEDGQPRVRVREEAEDE